MTEVILVLNVGSSSIKFAIYPAAEDDSPPILRGKISGIGTGPELTLTTGRGDTDAFGGSAPTRGRKS